MVSRNPDPQDRSKMSQSEKLCWLGALILGLMIVGLNAREAYGVTTAPDECALTAMAALTVAKTPSSELEPFIRNKVDLVFVQFSKYIWRHAKGDDSQFLRWYRLACVNHRVPRYYRVVNGEMVRGNGA